MRANTVFKDLKQEKPPTQDLSYKRFICLLQVFLAALLYQLQRLVLTHSFSTSAVVEDEKLHHLYDSRKMGC